VPCPIDRHDVVKLDNTSDPGIADWFGVVTGISASKSTYYWRTDYKVRVKGFQNVLDAIEYSEKKRANDEKRRVQAEKRRDKV
jgi:hypothetical protein